MKYFPIAAAANLFFFDFFLIFFEINGRHKIKNIPLYPPPPRFCFAVAKHTPNLHKYKHFAMFNERYTLQKTATATQTHSKNSNSTKLAQQTNSNKRKKKCTRPAKFFLPSKVFCSCVFFCLCALFVCVLFVFLANATICLFCLHLPEKVQYILLYYTTILIY